MPPFRLPTRRTLLATAAALLFSTGSALAAKVSIPIVPRPAQPAAIAGWSVALTSAAQNAINASGKPFAPGGTVPAWIGINFSKHHIIAQTFLQVAAGLAANDLAGNAGQRQRLVAAIRTIAAGNAGGPPQAWNLGPVVWAPVNLFEGPTGFYRSDDPGEGGEPLKPKSFNQTRWTLLQTALAAIQAVQTGTGPNGQFETTTDKLNQQQTGGKTGFESIVQAFEALANYAPGSTVHPFADTDWVDNQSQTIRLGDLIVYNQNQIQVAVNQAKRRAYRLR